MPCRIDGQTWPAATAAAVGRRQSPSSAGRTSSRPNSCGKRFVAKNLLYFHRWRPQNVTYLFGFRKHEQGQNAVEIPQFDPLVAAKEPTIRALAPAGRTRISN